MASNRKSSQSNRNRTSSKTTRSSGRGQQGQSSESMEKLRAAAARQDARRGVSAEGGMMSITGMQRSATAVGRGIADASGKAVEAVASNPIPAAMISAGLAWLLVQSVNRRTHFIERA